MKNSFFSLRIVASIVACLAVSVSVFGQESTFNGVRYEVVNTPSTWFEAHEAALGKGGHLAVITSANEQEFVLGLIQQHGNLNFYWLGGYWHGDRSFKWITDETSNFANWAPGRPDNYQGVQDRLAIFRVSHSSIANSMPGQWDDVQNEGYSHSKTNFGYVIEYSGKTVVPPPPIHPNGAYINGVMWSTRNVDGPATFAARPESSGRAYQWGASTGYLPTERQMLPASNIRGDRWTNDPSPQGWRLPTKDELDKLHDRNRVDRQWTTQSGVAGMKFTDRQNGNSIFIPAAGYRPNGGNSATAAGEDGFYWGGTASGNLAIPFFVFFMENLSEVRNSRAHRDDAFYLRPVLR